LSLNFIITAVKYQKKKLQNLQKNLALKWKTLCLKLVNIRFCTFSFLKCIIIHYYYYYLAVKKALILPDKDGLPPHLDRDLLFGVDKICVATDGEAFDSEISL